jgi:hypothetical protein
MLLNFLLEFILIKHLGVGDRGHVSRESADFLRLVESQVGFESGNRTGDLDVLQPLNKWGVLIHELGALDLVGHVEVLHPFPDVLHGLDHLGSGLPGSQQVDFVVLFLEKQLPGVGGVDEGSGLGLHPDLILRRLLLLLGEQLVVVHRHLLVHSFISFKRF